MLAVASVGAPLSAGGDGGARALLAGMHVATRAVFVATLRKEASHDADYA
jgi:hypothetical protein